LNLYDSVAVLRGEGIESYKKAQKV
jgi:hypothetical protein